MTKKEGFNVVPWQIAILGQIGIFYEKDGSFVCIWINGLLKDRDYIMIAPTYRDLTIAELKERITSQHSQQRIQRIDEDYIDKHPLTYIEFGSHQWKLLDGNHRYIKAHQLKLGMVLVRYVPKQIWRRYIVDMDDDRFHRHLNRTRFVSLASSNK